VLRPEIRALKIHLEQLQEWSRGFSFGFVCEVSFLTLVGDSFCARKVRFYSYRVAEKNAIPKGICLNFVQKHNLHGFKACDSP
jgi:hypothetical protein